MPPRQTELFAKAEAALRDNLGLDEETKTSIRLELGLYYLGDGNLGGAKILKKVLDADPTNIRLLEGLACLNWRYYLSGEKSGEDRALRGAERHIDTIFQKMREADSLGKPGALGSEALILKGRILLEKVQEGQVDKALLEEALRCAGLASGRTANGRVGAITPNGQAEEAKIIIEQADLLIDAINKVAAEPGKKRAILEQLDRDLDLLPERPREIHGRRHERNRYRPHSGGNGDFSYRRR